MNHSTAKIHRTLTRELKDNEKTLAQNQALNEASSSLTPAKKVP